MRRSRITYREPTVMDIFDVGRRMRAADRLECRAFGEAPVAALEASVAVCRQSGKVYTGLVNGLPIFIFGTWELAPNVNGIWLLGTDDIERHIRDFYMDSKAMVAEFFGFTEQLTNRVCMDNEKTVRWLKKLGAEFIGERTILLGHPFQQFIIRR